MCDLNPGVCLSVLSPSGREGVRVVCAVTQILIGERGTSGYAGTCRPTRVQVRKVSLEEGCEGGGAESFKNKRGRK